MTGGAGWTSGSGAGAAGAEASGAGVGTGTVAGDGVSTGGVVGLVCVAGVGCGVGCGAHAGVCVAWGMANTGALQLTQHSSAQLPTSRDNGMSASQRIEKGSPIVPQLGGKGGASAHPACDSRSPTYTQGLLGAATDMCFFHAIVGDGGRMRALRIQDYESRFVFRRKEFLLRLA